MKGATFKLPRTRETRVQDVTSSRGLDTAGGILAPNARLSACEGPSICNGRIIGAAQIPGVPRPDPTSLFAAGTERYQAQNRTVTRGTAWGPMEDLLLRECAAGLEVPVECRSTSGAVRSAILTSQSHQPWDELYSQ